MKNFNSADSRRASTTTTTIEMVARTIDIAVDDNIDFVVASKKNWQQQSCSCTLSSVADTPNETSDDETSDCDWEDIVDDVTFIVTVGWETGGGTLIAEKRPLRK